MVVELEIEVRRKDKMGLRLVDALQTVHVIHRLRPTSMMVRNAPRARR